MRKLLAPNRAGNSVAPRPHRLNIPLACFILQPTEQAPQDHTSIGTPRPYINGYLLARTLITIQNLGRGWVRYSPTTRGVRGTRVLPIYYLKLFRTAAPPSCSSCPGKLFPEAASQSCFLKLFPKSVVFQSNYSSILLQNRKITPHNCSQICSPKLLPTAASQRSYPN